MSRVCHFDSTEVPDKQWCETCINRHKNRVDAKRMTKTARVEELKMLLGVLEMPFDLAHQRIEELVGRSVWTHEMAFPDSLFKEIENENV